ncbi:MAG: terminase small subunit [Gemmatimonadota bacterium]
MASEELPSLTPRRAAFVQEYLIDLNGAQAAIRAGYAPNSASVEATRLLADASVAAAVERAKAQRFARVNTNADSVLHEVSLLAQSCVEHYEVDDYGNLRPAEGAPEGAMRAISSVKKKIRHAKDGSITYEVEFRLWDKPGSLKLMGKHAGVAACFDKLEVTGKDGGPIAITQVRSIIVDPKADE